LHATELMLNWDRARARESVLPMTRRVQLTSGLEIAYALGLTVNTYRGLREISHSGSTAGYGTYLARYPEQNDLSIAVMCNVSGAGATGFTHAIVDAVVPGLPRAATPDTVRADAAIVAKLAGIYRDTRTNLAMVLDTSRGQLRRDGGTVVHAFMAAERWNPSASELASIAGRYRNEEIGVTFTVAAAGVTAMHFGSGRAWDFVSPRVK